ncbi:NUDIX domain-containing protein [Asticcacaulis sp. EMRT-3]|uniref:NUDIX domain-containing protein n=1 Tax=Asticcacaulis sp. EMRT-3 TaxID=3040349 RepID=UPI0024AFEFA2|nr:NUDIX domain-containing protein [Asticcacaulis sp. EMRT-3]MDI7773873.1 NUDIX domain-containing protein [Asticcacaulis sp. EMRT-3]
MNPTLRQFGQKLAGHDYQPRSAAYGLLTRGAGENLQIACVRIGYQDFSYDLPGGAVDPGETPEQAVVREFGEETGLRVSTGRQVGELLNYFIHENGTPFNNHCHFYEMSLLGEAPELQCEPDHERLWLYPLQLLVSLKHEAYAWVGTRWLRDRAISVT